MTYLNPFKNVFVINIQLTYNIVSVVVVQHSDLTFIYTLRYGHHSMSIIVILSTVFPVLYVISLGLVYFITRSLYLVFPFALFIHPPALHPRQFISISDFPFFRCQVIPVCPFPLAPPLKAIQDKRKILSLLYLIPSFLLSFCFTF